PYKSEQSERATANEVSVQQVSEANELQRAKGERTTVSEANEQPEQKARLEGALGRQVARLDRRIGRLEALSSRYSWSRLGIVLGGGGASWLVFATVGDAPGAAVLLAAVAAFGVAA